MSLIPKRRKSKVQFDWNSSICFVFSCEMLTVETCRTACKQKQAWNGDERENYFNCHICSRLWKKNVLIQPPSFLFQYFLVFIKYQLKWFEKPETSNHLFLFTLLRKCFFIPLKNVVYVKLNKKNLQKPVKSSVSSPPLFFVFVFGGKKKKQWLAVKTEIYL